ncbi:DNA mismatch repair endonuclease MutL [Candidatus Nomurabacteria bacterium]|nr:DNA mismatch repair endonuclease MutL [Candidatus Nomurabacteria bacterium]
MNREIIQLPQEIINKIAAGEVVERPASVVKELVDNSIDAGSTSIQISIKDGGQKLIEVIDDGIGIPEDQISNAFIPHATSKIRDFEDLNTLLTLGFRGEALSTIASVSQIEVISKVQDEKHGYIAHISNGSVTEIKPNPREVGTTIRVRDLFKNIPARSKFLRKAQTEYKYILAILMQYFLINPSIRFKLFNEDKLIYDLHPSESEGRFSEKRIDDVLQSDFSQEMIELFYDGAGINISGFIAHPKYHVSRTTHTYIFVNGRPVTDRGVIRSIIQGCGSFIPRSEKVPFVINIDISPSSVDVNVHPRKEEVRFLNPYRVYSAIENAVNKAYERELGTSRYIDNVMDAQDAALVRFRDTETPDRSTISSDGLEHQEYQASFTSGSLNGVNGTDRSSLFGNPTDVHISHQNTAMVEMDHVSGALHEQPVNVFQIFKKYLVYEFENELWLLDQHAAAERITFERLKANLEESTKEVQELLLPEEIKLSKSEIEYLRGISEQLLGMGFTFELKDDSIQISAVPAELATTDLKGLVNELIDEQLSDDIDDITVRERSDSIIATVACHNSIRTDQSLHKEEILSILAQLFKCTNPYSCPHGRPIIWKSTLEQIDSNFERTY